MPIYTPLRFRISPSPRNPKKKESPSSAADGRVRPAPDSVRSTPPPAAAIAVPPRGRAHIAAPAGPQAHAGPSPARVIAPPPHARSRRHPPRGRPPGAPAPPLAIVAGPLLEPRPRHPPARPPPPNLAVATTGPRRPRPSPPAAGSGSGEPPHAPAVLLRRAPTPVNSAPRSTSKSVPARSRSGSQIRNPRVDFCLSPLIFMHSLSARISATVDPF